MRRRAVGLENVDDLKADLDRSFAALKAAWDFDRATVWVCPMPPRHPGMLPCPIEHSPARSRVRIFAWFLRDDDNHPFTMTVNPAVRSTKNFTPQVPLYL